MNESGSGEIETARGALARPTSVILPASWHVSAHEAGHALISVYLGFGVRNVSLFVITEEFHILNHVQVIHTLGDGCVSPALALTAAAGQAAERLSGAALLSPIDEDLALFVGAGQPAARFSEFVDAAERFFAVNEVTAHLLAVTTSFQPRYASTFYCPEVMQGFDWIPSVLLRAHEADLAGQNGSPALREDEPFRSLGEILSRLSEGVSK